MKVCTYDARQAGAVVDDKVYPIGAAMVSAGILKADYTMVQVIEAMTGNPDAPACVDECIRSGDSVPLAQVTLRAPVDNPTSLWAAAANYMDHRKEMETRMGGGASELPDKDDHMSQDFLKPVSSIIGPGGTVIIPKVSHDVDFECELCVVIGKTARKVTEEEALDYVFGYTICWDISQRDPWGRGKQNTRNIRKGFDTFSPQGPWIVTRDEIPEPQDLSLTAWHNGEQVMTSHTSNMSGTPSAGTSASGTPGAAASRTPATSARGSTPSVRRGPGSSPGTRSRSRRTSPSRHGTTASRS